MKANKINLSQADNLEQVMGLWSNAKTDALTDMGCAAVLGPNITCTLTFDNGEEHPESAKFFAAVRAINEAKALIDRILNE